MDQELPAVYAIGKLNRLMTYTGDTPFASMPLNQIPKIPSKGDKAQWTTFSATEHWAAVVDEDDCGLGVIHPDVVRFIRGFYGKEAAGGPNDDPTSYVAPVRKEVLDHNIVYDFTYTLVLDTLDGIRKEAYKQQPNSTLPDYRFKSDRQHWWFMNAEDLGQPINGYLRVKTERDDPQLFGPEECWAAKDAPTIFVRAAYRTKNRVAGIYWESADRPGFDPKQKVEFAVETDGKYRTYEVDLSASSSYRGLIRRLRFDPVETGAVGDYADIEFIASKKE